MKAAFSPAPAVVCVLNIYPNNLLQQHHLYTAEEGDENWGSKFSSHKPFFFFFFWKQRHILAFLTT